MARDDRTTGPNRADLPISYADFDRFVEVRRRLPYVGTFVYPSGDVPSTVGGVLRWLDAYAVHASDQARKYSDRAIAGDRARMVLASAHRLVTDVGVVLEGHEINGPADAASCACGSLELSRGTPKCARTPGRTRTPVVPPTAARPFTAGSRPCRQKRIRPMRSSATLPST